MIIPGNKIAKQIYDDIKKEISNLEKKPTLGVILVGKNSPSLRYINQKRKWAEYVGMNFVLKELDLNIKEADLLEIIEEFNKNDEISGFMIQFPLPDHINKVNVINAIKPEKDVDGFTAINTGKTAIGDNSGLFPCTPSGIIHILNYLNINLVGKNITVVGRSNIVGKPVTNMLMNLGATVINCNSKTKNISDFTLKSDIIISAAGKPGLITENIVKNDAIIIDVGFSVINDKIYGDCDIKSNENNKITPVPGGVGPLTVAMLIKNTLKAKKS